MPGYKRVRGTGGQLEPTVVHAKNLTDLNRYLTDRILWATKDELVYYSSIDCMMADVLAMADGGEFELNIGKDVWVTPSRWSTLIRQYVNPDMLFHWLSEVKRVSTYNRGIIAMDMQSVAYQKVESNPRASRRRSGACMRMVTYRAFPQPTVSLHSRTTYLGYIGELDLLLGHKLIELAADMIGEGLSVDDFAFRWKIEVAQVHGFKSLAFIFATGQDKYMRVKEWPEGREVKLAEGRTITLGPIDDHPTWKIVRSWWKRIHGQDRKLLPYSANKYGAEKRIRRRYHSQMGIDQTPFLNGEKPYVPLSTPIGEITLDRMLYKTPESRAVIRKAKKEKSEKLVTDLFDDDDLDWLPGSEDFADLEEVEVD